MADPTPDLSAVIAALTDATPETLREDAECAMRQAADVHRLWTFPTIDDAELQAARAKRVQSFQRLAALALAIAAWSERPTRLTPQDNSWDDEDHPLPWSLRTPMSMEYTHHVTLPAALASLLSSEPAP